MQKILNFIIIAAMTFPTLVFSIVFHEVAHGWTANKLGDPTARHMGRITLNPIRHVDIVGSIVVPLLLLIAGQPVFGWAKPVPVNPYNLRNPRRDSMLVSAAGPGSNILLAFCGIVVYLVFKRVGLVADSGLLGILGMIIEYLVLINVLLAVFNLLPIPPLDGGWLLEGVLKGNALHQYQKVKPYGFIILIVFIYTGIFSFVVKPVFSVVYFILNL